MCSPGWMARCGRARSAPRRCRCQCGGHNHAADHRTAEQLEIGRMSAATFQGRPSGELLAGAAGAPDIILVRENGEARANVPHRWPYHSPTGFEWGFSGSGPADLALNILGLFVDAATAWALHQDLKREIVAHMPPEGGRIAAATIRAWLQVRLPMIRARRLEVPA